MFLANKVIAEQLKFIPLGEGDMEVMAASLRSVWLAPANSEYKPIRGTEEMEMSIFGRYTGLIRKEDAANEEPALHDELEGTATGAVATDTGFLLSKHGLSLNCVFVRWCAGLPTHYHH